MKKIMLVFGTRPEAIKMCPLVKEFQKRADEFETIVCVTGQHREMLDQVLKIFEVTPDIDLNIMKQGQDLTDMTVRILTGMRDVFKECRPDVVLVHGDTTTSTAAALAAFYAQIPVGHVEAGLRTHNIYSPWPEEMNRQMTGRIAAYNFAPTPLSENNLIEEKAMGEIHVTGNTVIDALHLVVNKLKNDATLAKEQDTILLNAGYDVTRLADGKKLVLITGHRRENFGDGFIRMVTAMKDLSEKYPEVDLLQQWFRSFIFHLSSVNYKVIPSPNLAFNRVYILVHIYRHLFGEGIGLRQLLDYYFVLHQGFTEEERAETMHMLSSLKMERFAAAVMWVLQEVYGMEDRYLLTAPNEKEGRFLLSEIMLAGNFGHYDERMQHERGESALHWGLRKVKRNFRFVRSYPSEVLWSPLFKLWHWAWRRSV